MIVFLDFRLYYNSSIKQRFNQQPILLKNVLVVIDSVVFIFHILMKLNNTLLKILQQKDNYCRNIELYADYNNLPITKFYCF